MKFQAYRPAVQKSLETYIKERLKAPSELPWQRDVLERLMTFAAAGKLLRGSLVCYSYDLCSGGASLPATVLDTAVALELAHASLLVHDDIIDQDELRRGQPALHRQYSQLSGQAAPAGTHLGESLALCAGDMILLMAFELLGSIQSPVQLSDSLARELVSVCAGQMQDVYLTARPGPPSKRAIYAMMQAKSAGYSVAWPLLAGSRLAGQSATMQRRWYDLGTAAGTLFQIRDDELGVFGSIARLGKPVGSDIREGKQTLLRYYLWRSARAQERQQLSKIFGNPRASVADIDLVRQAMQHHQVSARLQADIERLKRDADRHIDQLRLSPTLKRELRQLVEFCAEREG